MIRAFFALMHKMSDTELERARDEIQEMILVSACDSEKAQLREACDTITRTLKFRKVEALRKAWGDGMERKPAFVAG